MEQSYIITEDKYKDAVLDSIGGKAKGIGLLISAGANVPRSFCITTEALRIFTGKYLSSIVKKTAQNSDGDDNLSLLTLRSYIESTALPQAMIRMLTEKLTMFIRTTNQSFPIILRSSHKQEDSKDSWSSGQYISIKIADYSELEPAIKMIWLSNYSDNACSYKASRHLPRIDFDMGILVQQYIPAIEGGVLATTNLLVQDTSSIIISFSPKGPESVVNGENSITLSHNRYDNSWAFVQKLLNQLRLLALSIERKENCPIQLEWLINPQHQLMLLQLKRLVIKRAVFARYIMLPEELQLRSPKFAPLRYQYDLGLNQDFEAHIVTPLAYEAFKHTGIISDDLLEALIVSFEHFKTKGYISVRSLYWSDINSSNNFLQSGHISTLNEFLDAIKKYWQFIIENSLEDYTSEPALMISNWLDVKKSILLQVNEAESSVAHIAANYGFPEGLEQNVHDIYTIDIFTDVISSISVGLKSYYVPNPKLPPVPLPDGWRKEQILSGEVLRKIAAIARKLIRNTPTIVAEFLITADEKIIVWQVSTSVVSTGYYALKHPSEIDDHTILAKGNLLKITNKEELFHLQLADKNFILFLDLQKENLRDRNWIMDVIMKLQTINLPFAYLGSMLSHFATTAIEANLKIFPVNSPPKQENGSIVAIVKQC